MRDAIKPFVYGLWTESSLASSTSAAATVNVFVSEIQIYKSVRGSLNYWDVYTKRQQQPTL